MQHINDDSPLEMLGLSTRTYYAVIRTGIDTVGKLLEITIEELKKTRNLGKKGAAEIRDSINDIRNGKNGILLVQNATYKLFYDHDGILRRDVPTKDMGLSARAYNYLNKSGIRYASEMINFTAEHLLSIQNMGAKTVREVMEKMKGIYFEAEVTQDQPNSHNKAIADEIFAAFEVEVKI